MEELLKKYNKAKQTSKKIYDVYDNSVKELQLKLKNLTDERDSKRKPFETEIKDIKKEIIETFLNSEEFIKICDIAGLKKSSTRDYFKDIIMDNYNYLLEFDNILEINLDNVRHSYVHYSIPKYSDNKFLSLKTLKLIN